MTADGSAFQNMMALNFITDKGNLNDILSKVNIADAYQIQVYTETTTYNGKSYTGLTLGIVRRADSAYGVFYFTSWDGVLLSRAKNNGVFTSWVRAN